MARIELEGDPIDDLPLATIVARAANPERPIYQSTWPQMDFHRNAQVLSFFGERDELDASEIAEAYLRHARGQYSQHFHSLRAGELISWAIGQGIVTRVGEDRWRLVQREPQFELVGPETKQRAMRVRGLDGAEAVVAAQLWAKELKRRERLRIKRVGAIAVATRGLLDRIAQHAPETKLGKYLQRFAVGGSESVVAAREIILADVLDMSEDEACALNSALRSLCYPIEKKIETELRARRLEAEQRKVAELDDIATMFPPAPPAPPPPPCPAEVRTRHERGMTPRHHGRYHLEIEGDFDAVTETVRMLRADRLGYQPAFSWPPGARTWDPPTDLGDGRWIAYGQASDNCD